MQFVNGSAGQTSWTDQLDGPAGRTSWTDQLDGPAGQTIWTDHLDRPVLFIWSLGQFAYSKIFLSVCALSHSFRVWRRPCFFKRFSKFIWSKGESKGKLKVLVAGTPPIGSHYFFYPRNGFWSKSCLAQNIRANRVKQERLRSNKLWPICSKIVNLGCTEADLSPKGGRILPAVHWC